MKKKLIITMCAAASLAVVAAAVFGLLAVFRPAPAGDAIVRIGKYPLSEQELRAAIFLFHASEDETMTCEKAARDYAQICIAADEIVGTEYAIEQNGWEDYLESSTELFDRDYDLNIQYCQQNGMTREDLIVSGAMMLWRDAVEGKHVPMIFYQYREEALASTSAESFSYTERYNEEMAEKAAKLRYVVLDPQVVQALDGFGVTHIDYEPD